VIPDWTKPRKCAHPKYIKLSNETEKIVTRHPHHPRARLRVSYSMYDIRYYIEHCIRNGVYRLRQRTRLRGDFEYSLINGKTLYDNRNNTIIGSRVRIINLRNVTIPYRHNLHPVTDRP